MFSIQKHTTVITIPKDSQSLSSFLPSHSLIVYTTTITITEKSQSPSPHSHALAAQTIIVIAIPITITITSPRPLPPPLRHSLFLLGDSRLGLLARPLGMPRAFFGRPSCSRGGSTVPSTLESPGHTKVRPGEGLWHCLLAYLLACQQ